MLMIFLLSVLRFSLAGDLSFICHNSDLYSSDSKSIAKGFSSNAECLTALETSQNGFVCNSGSLFSAGGKDKVVASFVSNTACIEAVKSSANGFICADADLYSVRSTGKIATYSSANDCEVAISKSR